MLYVQLDWSVLQVVVDVKVESWINYFPFAIQRLISSLQVLKLTIVFAE